MLNKKAIAILGAIFLLIVVTIAVLIFQKKSPSASNNTAANNTPAAVAENTPVNNQPADNTTPDANTTPTNTNPGGTFNDSTGAVKLSDDNVLSPVLFFQGNGVTYFNTQGQLFQSDLQVGSNGLTLANKRELTIPLKTGISKILWPATGNNFIAQSGIGNSKSFSSYMADRGAYVDLPKQITAVDWFPTGDKIMYIWLQNGKASLSMANPDATGFQTITELFQTDNDFRLSPDGKTVLFYRTQSTDSTNKIFLVTADGKLFKTAVSDGFNFGVLWAPDSRKFLYTKKDSSSGQFQVYVGDMVTGQTQSLGFSTTLDKIIWTPDSQFIIAATPKTGSSGSGDTVSKINVVTQAKNDVDPGSGISASDLFLSSAGDKLFFKNTSDGGLYYVNLP